MYSETQAEAKGRGGGHFSYEPQQAKGDTTQASTRQRRYEWGDGERSEKREQICRPWQLVRCRRASASKTTRQMWDLGKLSN